MSVDNACGGARSTGRISVSDVAEPGVRDDVEIPMRQDHDGDAVCQAITCENEDGGLRDHTDLVKKVLRGENRSEIPYSTEFGTEIQVKPLTIEQQNDKVDFWEGI